MAEKKKKVLFVATVDSHIELFHLPYLKMFHDKGWEVHVATETGKKIPYCDKKIKLPIKRSPFKLISNHRAIKELREVAKKEKYDIVHCHTPVGGVVARLACKKLRREGLRMIYTAHGFHFYTGAPVHYWMMFYPVEWYLAKHTDTLITINNEDYERARKRFSKRCRDIQYVPGVGVDEKKFAKKMSAKEKKALRRELGLGEDDKVLICVGRLDKNKNQGFLIRAMQELVAKDAHYQLLLVGPDEINGKYQQLAKKLGVSDHVHFLGFRNDIPELLQISDVAVSASKREGLPVNLIEAAMLGLPIVATDCRGNRDVCKECGGVIVNQEDARLFSKKITSMIKNAAVNKKSDSFGMTKARSAMMKIYFRKKRILHVLASDRYSGAENVACTIIEKLERDYDMAYCSPRGPIEKELKESGIQYYGISGLNHRSLRNVIADYDPDIIHAHDYSASCMTVYSKYDKKIISHLHNNNPFARYWNIKTIIYARCARKITKIVGVSNQVLEEAVFKNRIINKYSTVYNYVDYDSVIKKKSASKYRDEYDVCFIGRLTPQKNPLGFISIVDKLKQRNVQIKACMIGDGELRNSCHNLIEKMDLRSNIDLLGFQENPMPIIQNCKVVIMPSKWEGFGITAIESLILKKPVFNSGVGGLKEIFGEHSYFICNSDEEYVEKTVNNRPVDDAVFCNIYSKYTDFNKWIGMIEVLYA